MAANWPMILVTMHCCRFMVLVKTVLERISNVSVGASACRVGSGVLVDWKLFHVFFT